MMWCDCVYQFDGNLGGIYHGYRPHHPLIGRPNICANNIELAKSAEVL